MKTAISRIHISLIGVFSIFAFVFMFYFFTRIHPLVIYDADDWTYIAHSRRAIPIWGMWNPAKILPEILMPLCGSIAAQVIYPITGNYIGALTLITAFLVAAIIAIYLYSFAQILLKRLNLDMVTVTVITFAFFLAHFMIFRTSAENNKYLFLCHNVNCYYNYLILNLLCFIVVFHWINNNIHDFHLDINHPFKSGLLLLGIYLLIFANLYTNIVLAVYAGSMLILHFFREVKKPAHLMLFLRTHIGLFAILFMWCVCAVFETSGGRAGRASSDSSFISLLMKTVKNFYHLLRDGTNRVLVLGALLIVLAMFVLVFKNLKQIANTSSAEYLFLNLFICISISTPYFLLLSAKVNPTYISRVENIVGLCVYCLIFAAIALGYLVKKVRAISIVLPLVIAIMIFETNTSLKTFKESNTSNIPPSVCAAIDNDLVNQIIAAEQAGLTEMQLHVPVGRTNGNWPHSSFLGGRISNTLYKHGIIDRNLKIEIIPDASMNEKYHLSCYQ